MNHINTKRLVKDIKDLETHNLQSHGIYHYVNEDNIYNIKILMIGPDNTPYSYGFYLFDITIPEEYPFKPPLVKYCTQNGHTRFNPNLYVNGKVCLSILNTWAGPQWSSCNNISTILLSIQSMVFIENPLHNEPGFENDKSSRNTNYNKLVLYENLNTAIYKTLKSIPQNFIYFNSIIIKIFIDNYDKIIKIIENNLYQDKKFIDSHIYQMKGTLNYNELNINIIKLYNSIISDNCS
tara:strand:+ start:55 stop:765 length:711 start_codon:yes stop_codon:yes gene_type:complete